jgi:hypothetical protein
MAKLKPASYGSAETHFHLVDPETAAVLLEGEDFVQQSERVAEFLEAMSRQASGFFQTGNFLIDPEGVVYGITENVRSCYPGKARRRFMDWFAGR